jgi:3-keto-disaccharide hydrolase
MNYRTALLGLFLALTVGMVQTPAVAQGKQPADGTGGPWIQLFNGRDITGWTPKIKGYEAGENYADTFRVEDGVLRVSYDKYEGPFNDRFGHLFYDRPFSNYVLRVEYRIVGDQYAGGPEWGRRNSGIMIHGQTPESMDRDQFFPVSVEVQLLGSETGSERPTANVCTPGTVVSINGKPQETHCTNSSSGAFADDEWVTVEVEVHGDKLVRHKVNGQTVLEYTDLKLADEGPETRRLLEAGALKRLTGGTISLQSESHPIEFRKVELRELDE